MAKEKERAVTHWDPFEEIEALRPWGAPTELRQRLDELFGARLPEGRFAPAVDVTESENEYQVRADVPGIKKQDLTIEVQDGQLTIRGERKSEREEKNEKARRLERTYGAFSRSFTLPADADTSKVSASFHDGVLAIKIAKVPEAKPRQVAIKG